MYELHFLTAGTEPYGTAVIKGLIALLQRKHYSSSNASRLLEQCSMRVTSSRWPANSETNFRKSLTQVLECSGLQYGAAAQQFVVVSDDTKEVWQQQWQPQVLQIAKFEDQQVQHSSGVAMTASSRGGTSLVLSQLLRCLHAQYYCTTSGDLRTDRPTAMTAAMRAVMPDYMISLSKEKHITIDDAIRQTHALSTTSSSLSATAVLEAVLQQCRTEDRTTITGTTNTAVAGTGNSGVSSARQPVPSHNWSGMGTLSEAAAIAAISQQQQQQQQQQHEEQHQQQHGHSRRYSNSSSSSYSSRHSDDSHYEQQQHYRSNSGRSSDVHSTERRSGSSNSSSSSSTSSGVRRSASTIADTSSRQRSDAARHKQPRHSYNSSSRQ
jgi:hypothetical protein